MVSVRVYGRRESCPRNSRRASQESRLRHKTSTKLMQPAAGCAIKPQASSSRRVCAKATHVQHASASSSIIKIWIVLAASVHQHLPLSYHTSPLPPNAFSLPKHIPTLPLLLRSLQSIHTLQQPNKTLLCTAAGVSDSTYDVSPALRHFAFLSPIETQTQTLSLSRTSSWIEFLRVCGTGCSFSGLGLLIESPA